MYCLRVFLNRSASTGFGACSAHGLGVEHIMGTNVDRSIRYARTFLIPCKYSIFEDTCTIVLNDILMNK